MAVKALIISKLPAQGSTFTKGAPSEEPKPTDFRGSEEEPTRCRLSFRAGGSVGGGGRTGEPPVTKGIAWATASLARGAAEEEPPPVSSSAGPLFFFLMAALLAFF